MLDFDGQYHQLALALRLGNAAEFEVVGSGGRKNYQFLFSRFIKMIENDVAGTLINESQKNQVIQSLRNTIVYYDMKKPAELEEKIRHLKKDDPASFMIFPAYSVTPDSYHNHIYGLVIYKQDNDYLVAKLDKYETNKEMGNHLLKIPADHLEKLSKILFATKLEHHSESKINIIDAINQLSETPPKNLDFDMREYALVPVCPILEPLTTFRSALYHCQKATFTPPFAEGKVKPKFCSSMVFRKRFYQTFLGENTKHNEKFSQLWKHYEQRKNITGLKETISRDDFVDISDDFVKKVYEDPKTPKKFVKNQSVEVAPYYYHVFYDDSRRLKRLDAHINAIIDGTDQPFKEGFRQKVKAKSQRFGGTVKTVKDRIFSDRQTSKSNATDVPLPTSPTQTSLTQANFNHRVVDATNKSNFLSKQKPKSHTEITR
ncbi:hypothetical protein [Enterococcus mundtii]|uniref:hypothetical protein n=1 Tax=Enterococcus mundtii TaxID=53346 RepID=UPI0039710C78